MFLSSAMVVGGIGFLPIYFCQNSGVYSKEDIWKQKGAAWVTIFGKVYDMNKFIDSHVGGRDGIRRFLGDDASTLFPRLPAVQLPSYCLNLDKGDYFTQNAIPTCTELTGLDVATNVPCHSQLPATTKRRKWTSTRRMRMLFFLRRCTNLSPSD